MTDTHAWFYYCFACVCELWATGMISTKELHAALTRIGQRMDPQAATGFIRAADRHNTGQVNYRDFARLLTR